MKSIHLKKMPAPAVYLALVIAMPVVADDNASYNPMFDDKKHQIMIHGGKSFRSKDQFENLFFGGIAKNL
ncbi:hypothetical protein [Spartinivicinus poritis]|uniref:Uncharacterized protein n=1 Tax=Spartinivicinus poritis TaxID=2994640 RepID=A0ABT5UE52_9GAMM|nr:hypothetical protein [Spartinivicinus sp. A2-2]MDE1464659.1 hypothetical protein [Spartinivicinus sp. A2-2]